MKLFVKIFSFLIALILTIVLVKLTAPLITDNAQFRVLVSEAMFAAAVLGWFVVFVKFWDRERVTESVIFPKSSTSFFLFWGFLVGFCLIFVTYVISRATGVLAVKRLPVEGTAFAGFIAASIVSTVFAAFWEELAFRGFLLKKLITGIGRHPACLLVALIFGLLHLLSPVKSVNIVISTVFSGLLLNYAFLYSENLYFPMGIHFAWNFFLGKIFYSKQLFEVGFVKEIWAGYKNPEEGIVAISVTAAGFLMILLLRKKIGKKALTVSDARFP